MASNAWFEESERTPSSRTLKKQAVGQFSPFNRQNPLKGPAFACPNRPRKATLGPAPPKTRVAQGGALVLGLNLGIEPRDLLKEEHKGGFIPGASTTLKTWGHDPFILGNDPIFKR